MHLYSGTNNRAPRLTLIYPCKPEVRPSAREESASPAWLAAPTMNARDTTKVYVWRLDTGCGPILYRKCHSHNTPGKMHNNTNNCESNPSQGTILPGRSIRGSHQVRRVYDLSFRVFKAMWITFLVASLHLKKTSQYDCYFLAISQLFLRNAFFLDFMRE